MHSETQTSIAPAIPLSPFAYVAPFCAAGAALLGVLVLAGWAAGWWLMQRLAVGGVVTAPNAAVGFVAAGASLLLLGTGRPPPWRRVLGCLLAGALIVLGAVSLLQYAAGMDAGIDRLLFAPALASYQAPFPGRVTVNAAAAFVLLGAGLLAIDAETERGVRPAELAGVLVLLVAFLALVGHAYGFDLLYTVGPSAGMALTSAVALLILALGLLFARPGRGVISLVTAADASGVFLRRILPTAVLGPVLFGWAWVAARDHALLTRDAGVSLFVAAVVAVFVTVVIASAVTVRALDREREALLAREQAARAEAEQANRAKADFLATMSHELRTPLNAITGYSDLLDLGLRGELTEAQREDVTRIRRSSQYLLGLINDTLNFARLEAGRVEIDIDDVPLHDVLAGMETLVAMQVAARRLRYEYRGCEHDLRVRADRERLEQILVNLLTNACKFTEPGGLVALWCERRAHQARVVVHDTGRGIPPDKLSRIFEPFVQVDRHLTHESQQGVGLGLAISRDLARAMGGDLTATSEPGQGSTFVLTLPRFVERAADRAAEPGAAAGPRRLRLSREVPGMGREGAAAPPPAESGGADAPADEPGEAPRRDRRA